MSMLPARSRTVTPKERRSFLLRAVVKALALTAAVLAVYYLLPLDRLQDQIIFLVLAVELVLLSAVVGWQVRRVLTSSTPLLSAVEALALTVPFFLVMFAAMYVGLAANDPANFSQGAMTHTDGLYFTVTVFATVGFGDITPTSQLARGLVTVQMLLDLVVLGLLIRVFFGAVQQAWKSGEGTPPSAAAGTADGPTG